MNRRGFLSCLTAVFAAFGVTWPRSRKTATEIDRFYNGGINRYICDHTWDGQTLTEKQLEEFLEVAMRFDPKKKYFRVTEDFVRRIEREAGAEELRGCPEM